MHLALLAPPTAAICSWRPCNHVELAPPERHRSVAEATGSLGRLHILVMTAFSQSTSLPRRIKALCRVHRGIGSGQSPHHFCHISEVRVLLAKLYVHVVFCLGIVGRVLNVFQVTPLVYGRVRHQNIRVFFRADSHHLLRLFPNEFI